MKGPTQFEIIQLFLHHCSAAKIPNTSILQQKKKRVGAVRSSGHSHSDIKLETSDSHQDLYTFD